MPDIQRLPIRVLVVDDEHPILDLYRAILTPKRKPSAVISELGELAQQLFGETTPPTAAPVFDLVACQQGDLAVATVKAALAANQPFAVAFLDVRMPPGPDGIWTAEQIRGLDPQIEIVIVTAYSDIHPADIERRVRPAHKILYLQKPFHSQEILQFASSLSAKWLAEHELRTLYAGLERRVAERTQELSQANAQLRSEIEERRRIEVRLRQLEKAVGTMPLGLTITDLEGKIIYINQAGAEMHGYQSDELLGQAALVLTSPEWRKPLAVDQIRGWKGLLRESLRIRKDGTTFPAWLTSEVVQDAEGEPFAIVTSYEDITERKQAEEALRRSEAKYRIVLESDPDPVMVFDSERKITYLNPAFTRVFGWTLKDTLEVPLNFIPVEHLPDVKVLLEKIALGETISGVEITCFTKYNTQIVVSVSGAGFFDSHGTLQGYVISLQDITARKKTEEEIKFLAYKDALTGLNNRKSFYLHLEDEILRTRSRAGTRRIDPLGKWALLFLDLNQFKHINDSLGHDIGDQLLCAVGDRIQTCLRKSDYVFRLGGDEFTIILHNFINDSDIAKVAEKIRKELAIPFCIKQHELFISASIGISVYPDNGEDVETLVKNADLAMYAAKEGHLGYRFFTEEMNRNALERMKLESQLHNALPNGQLSVYYQPFVDRQERIIGAEALLRWYHPESGMISPGRFIPIAEETGAIIPIGKWVLHTACQQATAWRSKGFLNFQMAVNLSTRQFKERDLIETVEDALERTGFPPTCLKLEVTESGIMENPEQAIGTMTLLRQKGIRFSLDDFGTGYSSLSYLKRFPIDTVKIDRSFVMDCLTSKDDQEIIRAILAMAQNLGMDTVAEGVETNEQKAFLIQEGCQSLQGYYFGRPMPAQKFETLLLQTGTVET